MPLSAEVDEEDGSLESVEEELLDPMLEELGDGGKDCVDVVMGADDEEDDTMGLVICELLSILVSPEGFDELDTTDRLDTVWEPAGPEFGSLVLFKKVREELSAFGIEDPMLVDIDVAVRAMFDVVDAGIAVIAK